MRIGFDVSQTGRFKTGCGYFADALARELVLVGREHEFILYPTFGAGWWDPEWSRCTLDVRAPNVRRGPGQRRLDLLEAFWLDPPSDHEALLGSPDVVHSNNFFCPTTLSRARLVYTLHDLAFLDHPEWTTEANWRVCFEGVFNASVCADHVVAVSEFTRRRFLETFPHFPEARISVVYEASRFSGPIGGPPSRSLRHLRPGEFWLGIGDDAPRKNLSRLLEAYARLRASAETEYPLVLFGGRTVGKDGGRHVERVGYLDDTSLAWLYENCIAFCYPSLYEGFGLPVIEAMSLGAAVITSNLTSLPEVTGDSAALVDPLDVQAIYAALRCLATDDNERKRLRNAARGRARAGSWRTAAARVLDIYDSLRSEYPRIVERKPLGIRAAESS
jgi:glycosyltransferase involved in cell wall biosynthesis